MPRVTKKGLRLRVYPWIHFWSCLIAVGQSQSGIALPLIAVFLTAIVAMMALMLDTSRIAWTATEVQSAADVAASAGAQAHFRRPPGIYSLEAIAALSANKVDNRPLSASNLQSLQLGTFDHASGFTPTMVGPNAVRAVVSVQVDNMLAGSLDSSSGSSTVTKQAVAAFRALGSGTPTFPMVLGECNYQGDCFSQNCMPTLFQSPSTTDNSAWTTFFDGSVSTNDLKKYMDDDCDGATDLSAPFLKVGDIIELNNGQSASALKAAQDMFECGFSEVLIPIVPCGGNFNDAREVLGFATIQIDFVKATGSPKGIWLHGIYSDTPGSPGGQYFGTGTFGLVQ